MSIKNLIKSMGIDESVTIATKPKKYNKVKQNMIPVEDGIFQMDLIELPETREKFKYLATVTDLANDDFDCEPLRTKESVEVRNAFNKILKRKYLNKPYILTTDSGAEFMGEFDKYLDSKAIYHRTTMTNRHIQTANVEALNKQLVRILYGYMNKMERQTKRRYNEWTDVIPHVREELNKIRHKTISEEDTKLQPIQYDLDKKLPKPKYEVGDVVHYQLQYPRDALGKKLGGKFRIGDEKWSREVKPIQNIFLKQDQPYFRYQLKSMPEVTFYEEELKPSDQTEETYIVKGLLDKKKVKKLTYYLVWYQGYKKSDATWEPETALIEDGMEYLIDDYNERQNNTLEEVREQLNPYLRERSGIKRGKR
ncbi:MAG: transposase [Flavobacterium sp.]|nr:MAG: transposase [Flavobacterium sp.]